MNQPSKFSLTFRGVFISLLVLFSGCVSLETQEEISIKSYPKIEKKQGVYHKVKKGETLWRIAKVYDVPMDSITRANNIPRTAKIEKNQLVFIPGAYTTKNVVLDAGDTQAEFIWPVKGKVIKYYHEHYDGRINKGIHIKAHEGEEVKAARTGRVVFADYLSGYGHTVILDHSDGLHSVYAQNSKILVNLGALALKNSAIAHVGRSSNLAYLHFEIRKNSKENNPLYYLP